MKFGALIVVSILFLCFGCVSIDSFFNLNGNSSHVVSLNKSSFGSNFVTGAVGDSQVIPLSFNTEFKETNGVIVSMKPVYNDIQVINGEGVAFQYYYVAFPDAGYNGVLNNLTRDSFETTNGLSVSDVSFFTLSKTLVNVSEDFLVRDCVNRTTDDFNETVPVYEECNETYEKRLVEREWYNVSEIAFPSTENGTSEWLVRIRTQAFKSGSFNFTLKVDNQDVIIDPDVSTCGTLSSNNVVYNITGNINNTDNSTPCLIVTGANDTIDGHLNTLFLANNSITPTSLGVRIDSTATNTTLQNLIVTGHEVGVKISANTVYLYNVTVRDFSTSLANTQTIRGIWIAGNFVTMSGITIYNLTATGGANGASGSSGSAGGAGTAVQGVYTPNTNYGHILDNCSISYLTSGGGGNGGNGTATTGGAGGANGEVQGVYLYALSSVTNSSNYGKLTNCYIGHLLAGTAGNGGFGNTTGGAGGAIASNQAPNRVYLYWAITIENVTIDNVTTGISGMPGDGNTGTAGYGATGSNVYMFRNYVTTGGSLSVNNLTMKNIYLRQNPTFTTSHNFNAPTGNSHPTMRAWYIQGSTTTTVTNVVIDNIYAEKSQNGGINLNATGGNGGNGATSAAVVGIHFGAGTTLNFTNISISNIYGLGLGDGGNSTAGTGGNAPSPLACSNCITGILDGFGGNFNNLTIENITGHNAGLFGVGVTNGSTGNPYCANGITVSGTAIVLKNSKIVRVRRGTGGFYPDDSMCEVGIYSNTNDYYENVRNEFETLTFNQSVDTGGAFQTLGTVNSSSKNNLGWFPAKGTYTTFARAGTAWYGGYWITGFNYPNIANASLSYYDSGDNVVYSNVIWGKKDNASNYFVNQNISGVVYLEPVNASITALNVSFIWWLNGTNKYNGTVNNVPTLQNYKVNTTKGDFGNWTFEAWVIVNSSLNSTHVNSSQVQITQKETNVLFVNQSPSDLTSTNVFASFLVSNFNFTGSYNLTATPKIFYTVNNSGESCVVFINKDCGLVGFRNKTADSNTSSVYNFSLDDNDILPASYLVDADYMESTSHSSIQLNNTNTYLKIKLYNVSSSKAYNFFEGMVNRTSSVGAVTVYYGNSSYASGLVDNSSYCSNIGTATGYNHTESIYSASALYTVGINNSLIGAVGVSSTSFFLVRGETSNNVKVYGIANSSLPDDTVQITTDGGVTWSNVSGFIPDVHIHQFSSNDTVYYYAEGVFSNGETTDSATVSDSYNLSLVPPQPPGITFPIHDSYSSTINITYTAAIPLTSGSNISFYNISLLDSNQNFVQTIVSNNSLNLSYYWNVTTITTGHYFIKVLVTDSNNLSSFGLSDLFKTANCVSYNESNDWVIDSYLNCVYSGLSLNFSNKTIYFINDGSITFNNCNISAKGFERQDLEIGTNTTITALNHTNVVLKAPQPSVLTKVTLSANPSGVACHLVSVLTATALDQYNQGMSGQSSVWTRTPGFGSLGTTLDLGNGSYQKNWTGAGTVGTDTVKANFSGIYNTTSVSVIPGAPNSLLLLTDPDGTAPADGSTTITVDLQLFDVCGNGLGGKLANLTLTQNGTGLVLTLPLEDVGEGDYIAQWTSSTTPQVFTFNATYNNGSVYLNKLLNYTLTTP